MSSFTITYNLTQHSIGALLHVCYVVKNYYLITTINIITKLIEWFLIIYN